MIVALDGTGQFQTIQEAINSIQNNHKERITIYLKDGIYKEKLHIDKSNISLIGINPGKVKLTYDDYAKKELENGEMGTFSSYSTLITGDKVLCKNIIFENNAGRGSKIGQALAIYIDGSHNEFHNCSFLGFQDTIFMGPLPLTNKTGGPMGGPRDSYERRKIKSYFKECFIEGDVDFIFGSATAVFDRCEIYSKSYENSGYITAASTPSNVKHGFVFIDCRLIGSASQSSVYLGRPWRDYAKTVFINCFMGDHILKEGWHNWDKDHAEQTTYYAEYNSTGPSGNTDSRVNWSRILTDDEVKEYSIENILGIEGWPTLTNKQEEKQYLVYLAGDSTVENVYNANKSGWGQQIPQLLSNNVHIINEAKGGRSTKSFLNEGRLDSILSHIKSGDYLFIQFGHNDQKLEDPVRGTDPSTTYKENLELYISHARELGAIPILITSVNRRTFDEKGNIINSLVEYTDAMKDVAKSLHVPLIDLNDKSKALYEKLGIEESKKLFEWYDHQNPEIKQDNTHFNKYGAKKIAELVMEGIEELELPFIKKRIVKVFL